ncbi:type II toxin-antitoxin system RelE/ParE family toxin [Patescibacteria group bacterium]|nr:type II toxin-antitoxin system RelE/ParE family toxin [Patescibacteria group bacterium]
MAWEIRIEKKAQKELNKISTQYQQRIAAALLIIAGNPFVGKKLDGKLTGLYSHKIWPYRIIYKIYKKILLIVVIRIGHRQGIY